MVLYLIVFHQDEGRGAHAAGDGAVGVAGGDGGGVRLEVVGAVEGVTAAVGAVPFGDGGVQGAGAGVAGAVLAHDEVPGGVFVAR